MVIPAGRRRRDDRWHADEMAATVRTLAVLLQAGTTPEAAWRHLASSGDSVAERVVARVDRGTPVDVAMTAEDPVWHDVAAAWAVAAAVGAPFAEVLRDLAEALRDAGDLADEVRIALAEPAGTARLLLWLPPAGLLLGAVLGFDPLGVVLTQPLAAVCIAAGAALVLGARQWTRGLVRRAQPAPGTPGMHAELLAIALAGGASIERARHLVAQVRPEESPTRTSTHRGMRGEAVAASGANAPARTEQVLALSARAGVPARELLRASAAEERHRARVNGRMRAAELSSRLLLPLAVCTLPAFLLLGIVPLVLSVLAGTEVP